MTATTTPTGPDPSRTGAVWVTGTGAFLLLAAAAVFTAMRWDQIPDAVKLGALALATGAFLVAGRGLRASLPATAGALFHLGAFLVPLDVAAVGTRAELGWQQMLLAQGIVATLTFAWAAAAEQSVVLRWAFGGSVVALTGGIGATTSVPAPLLLAAFAGAAVVLGRDRLGLAWGVLAGTAPLLTFLDDIALTGAGTAADLGLTGDGPRLLAVLSGLTSAIAVGVVGRRRNDTGLVLVGVALATVGVVASWTGTDADAEQTLIALATVFLVAELTAYFLREDGFWTRPAGIVARVAECTIGAAGASVAALLVAFAAIDDGTDATVAVASLVLAGGWLVADRRRGEQGVAFATIATAASVLGAVASATPDDRLLAGALVAVAALALRAQRPGTTTVVLATTLGAPALVLDSPVVLALVGAAGSLLVLEEAVQLARRAASGGPRADAQEQWAWVLTSIALVPGAVAVAGVAASTGHVAAALIGGALVATLMGALADRAPVTADLPFGTLARIGAVAVLAGAAELEPLQLGIVAAVVAALSLAEAVRLQDPRLALGASIAVPVAIGALGRAADLTIPRTGVTLTLGAAVLAGLGALGGRRWALPVVAAVALSAGSGLMLAASGEPSAFADAVMITSGILLGASIQAGRLDGALASGVALTAGIWLRLMDAEVAASEPYLLPIAVLLLVIGVRARSIGTGSWVAYGPVIGILGGAALAERVAGGAGWHAVFAGTVGVVAVAAGGQRRLAAPLLLGTALLVALAGFETLALTASIPTWTWLALGGTVLLAVGIAMERHDAGPIETGRRLVDVIDDRFA